MNTRVLWGGIGGQVNAWAVVSQSVEDWTERWRGLS